LEVTGPGFTTVTLTGITAAICAAATAAVNCVALTKVVVSGLPFQFTTAAGSNPVPVTVSVNPGAPAVAELGLRLVIAGCPTAVPAQTSNSVTPNTHEKEKEDRGTDIVVFTASRSSRFRAG
jgi:hypothetical protein